MFKKIAAWLHLWLGLASGLVVFISLFAAAVFVWQEEWTNFFHRDKVFVPSIGKTELSVDSLLINAKKAEPGREITYVARSRDPRKAVVFDVVKPNPNPVWYYYHSAYLLNEQVYVDRYTGKVLGIVDNRSELIWKIYALHTSLLLKYEVGHYVVGVATLIIFVMAVTGIVLWWPKNKAALKQRFWFRWKKTTRWRRKNYDLHNIGGIYTWILILFFAATGLVWTFDWWEKGIYRLLGEVSEEMFPATKVKPADAADYSFESILKDATGKVPAWENIGLSLPEAKADSAQSLFCVVRYNTGSGWDEWDEYLYNSKSGKAYYSMTQSQKKLGEKWRTSNYAIHTGSIYGWPTKVLATLIALFCAFLPISGLLIWWGRKNKVNRKVS